MEWGGAGTPKTQICPEPNQLTTKPSPNKGGRFFV